MSTTFYQEGDVLDLTAPAAGVTAGVPTFANGLFVIPRTTAASGVAYTADVEGVHAYTKTGSQGWAEGQDIFWDATNSRFDSTPGIGPFVGFAAKTIGSGSGDTTGYVRLCCHRTGGVFHVRARVVTADINAGKTIIPGIAGRKLRLLDAFAIAYGGAVTATTTVDLLGTVTTARKLVAFGQAGLTQSTLVRAGAAAGVILADGASFTANDAGAGITVGKTGSDVATATGVDFFVTYAVDY